MALTAGHSVTCGNNSGGVRRVAIANRQDVASVTVSSGTITAITMVATKLFYLFENESETVEFIEEGTYTNKSKVFEQMLDASWINWTTADRTSLLQLYEASACGLVVIHEEEDGECWLWGINPSAPTVEDKYYVKMEKSSRKTGKKFDDPSQTDYQLKARTTEPAAKFTPGWAGVPLS